MINRTLRAAGPHTSPSTDRGNALLLAILMLAVVFTGTAGLLGLTVDAAERPRERADRFEARRAAASVNRLTARTIWDAYLATLMGDPPSMRSLRAYLQTQGLLNQGEAATPARTEFMGDVDLATTPEGNPALGTTEIASIQVHRIDVPRATQLVITTTAFERRGHDDSGAHVDEAVTEVFSLEPDTWGGLDFALLANNINCVMCHTTVDDVRRVYFGDGLDGAGPARRAKVGSIESLQLRDDPDSSITGTLYLGGPAIDENGQPITDWEHLNFLGASLDDDGLLETDAFGEPLLEAFDPSDPTAPNQNLYVDYLGGEEQVDGPLPDSFPLPFRDDGGFDLATGELTDTGAGNRRVDDNEFAATAAGFSGSITGGAVGVVAHGDRISSTSRARELVEGTQGGLGTVTEGNVVLTGTPGDPIRISGDVAIDGDLIISGPIEGTGSLWVRGNVYVRGDLTYADTRQFGERLFGLNGQGSMNALGLTAGGNIVMGDLYREQWGNGGHVTGEPSGPWNFTVAEAASFNRREWIKTQEELPGEPRQVQVGTRIVRDEIFTTETYTQTVPIRERRQTGTREVPVYERRQIGTREEPVYSTVTHNAGTPYERTERVQTGTRTVPVYERVQVGTEERPVYEWVTIGYRDRERTRRVSYDPPRYTEREEPVMEWQTPMYPNPQYRGADFVPRYYAFGEGDPVPIQNKRGHFDPDSGQWIADELANEWDMDELTLADPTNPADPTLFPEGRPAAAIETLEPTADWMDPAVLQGLIQDAMAERDPDEPFTVDATLYSANSIFGLVPNSPGEGTDGEILIEGAILAADLGLLGPAGTTILYDPRSQAVLDIRDDRRITLRLLGAIPTQRQ